MQLELFGHDDTIPERRGRPHPVVLPAPLPRVTPPTVVPDAPALQRRLSRLTKGRLQSVVLTDNRRTILSVRPGPPRNACLTLRIHRSFAAAPDEVLKAVATFVESRKGSDAARQALTVLRDHFSRHRGPIRPAARRRLALHPVGAVLDLRELRDDLNQRYFDGRLKAEITWGKGGGGAAQTCRTRRARNSTIQLGSYSYEDKLIRIHRALDQPHVPRYVVEAVVYHELLHAAIPPVVQNGRRHVHTPEFRRRERLFRHLAKAEAWVAAHLPELLRARGHK
jgi:hypothetical protein